MSDFDSQKFLRALKQRSNRRKKFTARKCQWCPAPTDDHSLCPRCRIKNKLRLRELRGSTHPKPGRPFKTPDAAGT